MTPQQNPHWGMTLDRFLREEGIYEIAKADALTRIFRRMKRAKSRSAKTANSPKAEQA